MAPSRGPSVLRSLWYKWKSLQLPWRRQFLAGADLGGNTFWEFKDSLNANRLRRIVKYPRRTHHGDVKISPQWHQWLRHTRDDAPSIQEQQYEVSRQSMMRQLAAEADERWKSKPSYLDAPNKQQPAPAISVTDSKPIPEQADAETGQSMESGVGDAEEVSAASAGQAQEAARKVNGKKKERDENPWASPQRGAPSEKWQPESWTPGVAQKRG